MKKLFVFAVLGMICFGSCAQKEEKREDFKDNHSVDEKRNKGVDSTALVDPEKKDSIKNN